MRLKVYILPNLKLTFVKAVLNTVVYQLRNRKRFPCLHSVI